MTPWPVPAERVPEEGGRAYFFIGALRVLLFRIAGQWHAIEDRCPHAGASLFGARLAGTHLRCPAHGLQFDLAATPAEGAPCLTRYPVSEENHQLILWLPTATPETAT